MSTETETTKDPKPLFDLATQEGRKTFFDIMCIIKGIDPNQVQGMAKFMNLDNNDERSYYPTQHTSISIAQLRMYGEAFYKGDEWNEYEAIADFLSIGFMGFKGFKSGQWKDIASGQPNLADIQTLPETLQQGVIQGIFNRGKKD